MRITFIPILLWLIVIICWIVNLIQLIHAALAGTVNEIIVHAIGLIPIASVITVWF